MLNKDYEIIVHLKHPYFEYEIEEFRKSVDNLGLEIVEDDNVPLDDTIITLKKECTGNVDAVVHAQNLLYDLDELEINAESMRMFVVKTSEVER